MTGARELTQKLGGRWFGHYGTAPCPVCQPDKRRDQTALTLSNGKARLLLHCKRAGCAFLDILGAAGIGAGDYTAPSLPDLARCEAVARVKAKRRADMAGKLWAETGAIHGTPAETYLRGRGIVCALPDTLRFHPQCWHGPTASRSPAMVALVEGGDSCAVHRTYLKSDGRHKAGLEGGDKLMLGATAGGAVRLSGGKAGLVVAEGIESGLSLLCGLLWRSGPVWAALSTSGIRSLRLPANTGPLAIACDGDTPGRAAGYALAGRADALGWDVSILDPGNGADFNDVLCGKAVAA